MSTHELLTFLRRTSNGGYRLEAEDGSLMLEGRTYRELREDLEVLVRSMHLPARSVKVLIGSARLPPRSVPASSATGARLASHG